MDNKNRPINLDLATIKFPIMAIVSIMHRLSGIVIFILLPMAIYFCDLSLKSAESFMDLRILLINPYYKFIVWMFVASLAYHMLAGMRHIFMDCGYGDDLKSGRYSAIFLVVLSIICIFSLGIWIW